MFARSISPLFQRCEYVQAKLDKYYQMKSLADTKWHSKGSKTGNQYGSRSIKLYFTPCTIHWTVSPCHHSAKPVGTLQHSAHAANLLEFKARESRSSSTAQAPAFLVVKSISPGISPVVSVPSQVHEPAPLVTSIELQRRGWPYH
jgi:hypothetical protein